VNAYGLDHELTDDLWNSINDCVRVCQQFCPCVGDLRIDQPFRKSSSALDIPLREYFLRDFLWLRLTPASGVWRLDAKSSIIKLQSFAKDLVGLRPALAHG